MDKKNVVVVAEKPSVAMEIANVLGCRQRREGCVAGNGYVVTWARGHLVGLAQPHEMNAAWRSWRMETLPMLPKRWQLSVLDGGKDQFRVLQGLLLANETVEVVCATDAGREGEWIFRSIYEATRCRKRVLRLWISSLTPEAIRKGFTTLRPWQEYDGLAAAAEGRAKADWLVGMNLTRAYTVGLNGRDGAVSVGRVQTPTLAMVVERDVAIERFVPEDYGEWEVTFGATTESEYKGRLVRPDAWRDVVEGLGEGGGEEWGEGRNASRSPFRVSADAPRDERWTTGQGVIERVCKAVRRESPPLLFDLTELQRAANRLYAFSAQRTMTAAQGLYEKKALSYPRTDSRYLSVDVVETLPGVVSGIEDRYRGLIAPEAGRTLGRRFVDDRKVTDHHAIIPTATRVNVAALNGDEQKIYDMVCRRLLMCWHNDYVCAVTTVLTRTNASNQERRDLWLSKGVVTVEEGWKRLEVQPQNREKGRAAEGPGALPGGLTQGVKVDVRDVRLLKKKTRAPARFTEAALLTAMESAGKTVSDNELSDAMKERGLGTPATRAGIIETLIERRYLVREGKALESTGRGRELIAAVKSEVKSPALTGQWEAYLKKIERGDGDLARFLGAIEAFVSEIVGGVHDGLAKGTLRPLSEEQRGPVRVTTKRRGAGE